MSHGPLMPCPWNVSTTRPSLLRTSRHPALAVAGFPATVGRLPTITQSLPRMARAVVRPTPPGHAPGSRAALIWANSLTVWFGATSTIVVPVPCVFALLLKLLTRTSPRWSLSLLLVTTATPYGLRSPFFGTVEAIVVMVLKPPMNEGWVLAPRARPAAGANATPTARMTPTAPAAAANMTRLLTHMARTPFRLSGASGPPLLRVRIPAPIGLDFGAEVLSATPISHSLCASSCALLCIRNSTI